MLCMLNVLTNICIAYILTLVHPLFHPFWAIVSLVVVRNFVDLYLVTLLSVEGIKFNYLCLLTMCIMCVLQYKLRLQIRRCWRQTWSWQPSVAFLQVPPRHPGQWTRWDFHCDLITRIYHCSQKNLSHVLNNSSGFTNFGLIHLTMRQWAYFRPVLQHKAIELNLVIGTQCLNRSESLYFPNSWVILPHNFEVLNQSVKYSFGMVLCVCFHCWCARQDKLHDCLQMFACNEVHSKSIFSPGACYHYLHFGSTFQAEIMSICYLTGRINSSKSSFVCTDCPCFIEFQSSERVVIVNGL